MPDVKGCNLPDDLLYDVENHIWFKEIGDGTVRIGMTTVATAMAGQLVAFTPKKVGQASRRPASPAPRSSPASGSARPRSAAAGEVVAVNEAAGRHAEPRQRRPVRQRLADRAQARGLGQRQARARAGRAGGGAVRGEDDRGRLRRLRVSGRCRRAGRHASAGDRRRQPADDRRRRGPAPARGVGRTRCPRSTASSTSTPAPSVSCCCRASSSADALLVLDAAQLDAAPGTVRVLEGATLDEFLRAPRCSVHELGLRDLLDAARLTDSLPARRALVGVQPRRVGIGDALSPAVAAAIPAAADAARAVLEPGPHPQPAEAGRTPARCGSYVQQPFLMYCRLAPDVSGGLCMSSPTVGRLPALAWRHAARLPELLRLDHGAARPAGLHGAARRCSTRRRRAVPR